MNKKYKEKRIPSYKHMNPESRRFNYVPKKESKELTNELADMAYDVLEIIGELSRYKQKRVLQIVDNWLAEARGEFDLPDGKVGDYIRDYFDNLDYTTDWTVEEQKEFRKGISAIKKKDRLVQEELDGMRVESTDD